MRKVTDIKLYFMSYADKYEYWHKRNKYYYQCLTNWFKFTVPEGKKVFELGSGDGRLCASLKPSKMSGMDFSEVVINKAKEKYPSGNWQIGNISEDLSDAEQYDYIVGADLISYIDDIQTALEEVRYLCDSRTRLVLTKLNPFWNIPMRIAAFFRLAQPRVYANWLGQKQVIQLLDLAGYDIVRMGKFCLVPVWIPLISNFVNRYIARLPFIKRFCAIEYFIARKKPDQKIGAIQPSVSVVIPARNEAGNIFSALERMPKFPGRLEVVFVEGNSTDDTWEKIKEACARPWPFSVKCLQQEGKGKGDAVRKGFDSATGDILMILDADLTVPPEVLPRFYKVLTNRRADYVQGTRLVYPMDKKAMRPLNWMGNKFFAFVFSVLLGQHFSDTLCGTKCMWKDDYQELANNRKYFGNFDPFGDFDLIFGSAKLNFKMLDIPIRYRARIYGDTNISRFRDGLLLIRMCLFAAKKLYFI